MLKGIDLETGMRTMSDRQLIEFIARQTYETCQVVENQGGRIIALEGRDKRAYGLAGFCGATVSAIGYFIQLWVKP